MHGTSKEKPTLCILVEYAEAPASLQAAPSWVFRKQRFENFSSYHSFAAPKYFLNSLLFTAYPYDPNRENFFWQAQGRMQHEFFLHNMLYSVVSPLPFCQLLPEKNSWDVFLLRERPKSITWAEMPPYSSGKLQRRNMFIETHPTPNINSLKFHPGRLVLEKGTKDFPNAVRLRCYMHV